MSYARARAHAYLIHGLDRRSQTLVADAETQARQERMVRGREQARLTREANVRARYMEELADREARLGRNLEAPRLYEGQAEATLGMAHRRFELHYLDPVTNELRRLPIYLPMPNDMSREYVAARIAAAISGYGTSNRDYEGFAALYSALLEGSIQGPDDYRYAG